MPSFDNNADGVVITGVATATSFVGGLTGNVTGIAKGNASGLSDVIINNFWNVLLVALLVCINYP